MTESDDLPGRERTLESLVQLVAALDRRVPQTTGAAEQRAALGASELRDEATLRIARLQRVAPTVDVAAVLSDDGMSDAGVTAAGEGIS